jgi:glycine hydroxymethyltransferase
MFCINVGHFREGLTGTIAQHCLEECGIIVNMNRLPYDPHSPRVTSGMRLGTPIVTKNGMGPMQMEAIAMLVDSVLTKVEPTGGREYRLDDRLRLETKHQVEDLCARFPMQ